MANLLETLQPFRLERFFAEHEFSVPYLLSSSDCQAMTVAELLALEPGASERFQDVWLGYSESLGDPALRQAIAGLYETAGSEHVLVHSGAQEAIFLFMQAVLAPGDHVIVHWPSYQSLAEVARSIGCQVTLWTTREADGWALDLDWLRANLRPATRAVIINTPHNPTGYLMDRPSQQELAGLAAERGFILFSDEVYRLLEYDETERLPAFCDLDGNAVSLGVMSKAFGLAGLRIGWIATRNAAVFRRMAELKDYTTICNSAPSEFLATLALRQGETILARNRRIIAANLAVLDSFFDAHAERFRWRRPKAGPIAFPALLGNESAEDFSRRMIEQAGVLLLPGTMVDAAYPQHFRIGFGRLNLPESLARLAEAL